MLIFAAGAANAGEWRSPIWGPAFNGHPDLAVQYVDSAAASAQPSFVSSLDRIQEGNPDGYPAGHAPRAGAQRVGAGWISSLDRIQEGNPDGYPHPSLDRGETLGEQVSGGGTRQGSTL
jgi:hypothetical protein